MSLNQKMPEYCHTEKGRSPATIVWTTLVGVLALGMFFSGPVFAVIGVFFAFLALSGVYAFLKGEQWSIRVEDGVFHWSLDRWPKSRGSIDLAGVSRIVVDDRVGKVLFVFNDGSSRKVRFVGLGSALFSYLKSQFPAITMEFVEGS